MIADFQVWLVSTLAQATTVSKFMNTAWAWPIMESVHFLGLCLLVGAVGTFDLRLLGVARQVPIAAVHRLIPWGLLGFALNVTTGAMFLVTAPDQYIFNPAFHLKLLFLAVAGLNAATFYLTSYRQVFGTVGALTVPRHARVIAAVSLGMWVAVIICGRLITFYRPGKCIDEAAAILTCFP